MERHDTALLDTAVAFGADTAAGDRAPAAGLPARCPAVDVTRIVTTTEVVVGAVLVARYLSQRQGSTKALVTMGPGGWVSMKGGTVAIRRGSRPFSRPVPVRAAPTDGRAPLWARVLSAVPLRALMR
jgi:hypothetical protein